MLEKELKVYDQNLPEWLKTNEGKFVLIKDNEIFGFFTSFDEALVEGARLFGLHSFLLREILPKQRVVNVPALTLGIIHADSTYSIHR